MRIHSSKVPNSDLAPAGQISHTEIGTQSPEYALVTALTLLSERSPVAKDPRMIFWGVRSESGSSLGSDGYIELSSGVISGTDPKQL